MSVVLASPLLSSTCLNQLWFLFALSSPARSILFVLHIWDDCILCPEFFMWKQNYIPVVLCRCCHPPSQKTDERYPLSWHKGRNHHSRCCQPQAIVTQGGTWLVWALQHETVVACPSELQPSPLVLEREKGGLREKERKGTWWWAPGSAGCRDSGGRLARISLGWRLAVTSKACVASKVCPVVFLFNLNYEIRVVMVRRVDTTVRYTRTQQRQSEPPNRIDKHMLRTSMTATRDKNKVGLIVFS